MKWYKSFTIVEMRAGGTERVGISCACTIQWIPESNPMTGKLQIWLGRVLIIRGLPPQKYSDFLKVNGVWPFIILIEKILVSSMKKTFTIQWPSRVYSNKQNWKITHARTHARKQAHTHRKMWAYIALNVLNRPLNQILLTQLIASQYIVPVHSEISNIVWFITGFFIELL